MTIQQLHYVITIAKAGSFNKAAEILYIAQRRARRLAYK